MGQEFEGVLEEGEQLWLTEADGTVQAEDDAAVLGKASAPASAPASTPASAPGDGTAIALVPAVEIHDDDNPAAIVEGVMQASTLLRLQELKKGMAALSKNVNMKRALMAVEQETLKIKRGVKGAKQSENRVIRRHMRNVAAKEASALAEHRKEVLAAQRKKAQAAHVKAKIAHTEAVEKAAREARADALAKLPQTCSPADLGQGQKNGGANEHLKARVRALEVHRLRSPSLPDDLRSGWLRLSKEWATQVGKKYGIGVGKHVVNVLGAVKTTLGSPYMSGGGKFLRLPETRARARPVSYKRKLSAPPPLRR